MRFFRPFFFCVLLITLSCKKETVEKTGIIPQPNFITYQEGSFSITENTAIVVDDSKEGQWIAKELKSFLDENFNLNLKITATPQGNAIQFIVNETDSEKEAYHLEISKDGVLITANSYQGVFYGIQSLKQLLTPKTIVKAPILNF